MGGKLIEQLTTGTLTADLLALSDWLISQPQLHSGSLGAGVIESDLAGGRQVEAEVVLLVVVVAIVVRARSQRAVCCLIGVVGLLLPGAF